MAAETMRLSSHSVLFCCLLILEFGIHSVFTLFICDLWDMFVFNLELFTVSYITYLGSTFVTSSCSYVVGAVAVVESSVVASLSLSVVAARPLDFGSLLGVMEI